jgi:DNA-binding response OmpR family regulator
VFIAVGSVAYAAGLVVVAEVRQPVVVGVYLVVVGTAWVSVQTTFMGAARGLAKPFSQDVLLAAITELLRGDGA